MLCLSALGYSVGLLKLGAFVYPVARFVGYTTLYLEVALSGRSPSLGYVDALQQERISSMNLLSTAVLRVPPGNANGNSDRECKGIFKASSIMSIAFYFFDGRARSLPRTFLLASTICCLF